MQNKENIKANFVTYAKPTESQFAELIDSCVGKLDSTNELPVASADNAGHSYLIGDTVYTCELVGGSYQWIAKQIGGGGGGSYELETNGFVDSGTIGYVDFDSIPTGPSIFVYTINSNVTISSYNEFYNNSMSYILVENGDNENSHTLTFGNIANGPSVTIPVGGKTMCISILTWNNCSYIASVFENNCTYF